MERIKYFHQPTISESLGNGWYTLKHYFLWLFVAVIIDGLFNGPFKYSFSNNSDNGNNWNLFENGFSNGFGILAGITFLVLIGILAALAITFLVRPVITYGANMMFVQAVRDQDPDIKWMFRGFQTNYFNIVLANLLTFGIVAMGFVALIIPGIFLACRLAFVSYLVMDKNLDPIRAVEESWRMTQGHGWTIFGLALVSIFIFILGLLCLFVGVFPAMIWIKASFASLYQAVLTDRESSQDGEFIYAQ